MQSNIDSSVALYEFNNLICAQIACNFMKLFLSFDSVLKMVLDFEWIDQAFDFFLSTKIRSQDCSMFTLGKGV